MLCTLAGCATAPSSGTGAGADDRPVYTVATSQEFVDAVGPDRVIQLRPGHYDLSKVQRKVTPHVSWERVFESQYQLVLRGVSGLVLEGSDDQTAHLVTRHADAFVLEVRDSDDFVLRNLRMGHRPDAGGCGQGVLGLRGTRNVLIDRCILYGCGSYGINLTGVVDLCFRDSVIEKCDGSILFAQSCFNLVFENSRFRRNVLYGAGFYFEQSYRVLLKNCRVEENACFQDAFVFGSSVGDGGRGTQADTSIAVVGGSIESNSLRALAKDMKQLKLKGVEIKGNAWQAPDEVLARRGRKVAVDGGWYYYVPVGVCTYEQVSIEVYGRWWFSNALRKANPNVPDRSIHHDVKLFCPADPPRNARPSASGKSASP